MGIRKASVIGPLLAAVAMTGCGGGGGSDTTQVKDTLTRAFHALATGDGATLCSLATPAGRAALASAAPHSSCVQVVQLASAHLSPAQKAGLENIQIGKVTIKGDHATVPNSSLSSSRGSLSGLGQAPTVLTKQPDGSWKISG